MTRRYAPVPAEPTHYGRGLLLYPFVDLKSDKTVLM
jgi:hypothetical protein